MRFQGIFDAQMTVLCGGLNLSAEQYFLPGLLAFVFFNTATEVNLFSERRIIANQNMLRTILTIMLLCPLSSQAQSAAPDPMSLPTRDAHQDLTIVADPYLRGSRYSKDLFGKNSFYNAGIIAIDVYFRNDSNAPIRLNVATVELVISQPGQDRQRLGALSPEDVADRTLLTATSDIRARRPFPFPNSSSGSGHSKEWIEMTNTLRPIAIGNNVFPPHATTHGFLFFDLNHNVDAIRSSHLYIPDLTFTPDNKALFFFEIDLAATVSR